MSDLKADIQRIREFSDGLVVIYDDFINRANPADGYSTEDLGSSDLASAFEEFADNWKIHRRELADKIAALGKITEDAANTYQSIDADLAAALRTNDPDGT
ncbi:MAG: hypothetical protein JO362_17310 [Streptomycetaceae bacterium]|nr:hypothetical protein [Streptomycetaceae bacterium]